MSDFYKTSLERQSKIIQGLREDLVKEKSACSVYFFSALVGWALMIVVLIWPSDSCASEREFTSIVIRCQQASDTCIKRERVYPTEKDCESANADVIATIGNTKDIVIAYCVSEGE